MAKDYFVSVHVCVYACVGVCKVWLTQLKESERQSLRSSIIHEVYNRQAAWGTTKSHNGVEASSQQMADQTDGFRSANDPPQNWGEMYVVALWKAS